MAELKSEVEDFHDWIVAAPNGTGVVFTLYNIITGGTSSFKFLRGLDIRKLPPLYQAHLTGTIGYETGVKMGSVGWGEINSSFEPQLMRSC